MKLPQHFYSWTTITGAVIAAISFLLIVFSLIISFIFPEETGNYLGLFTFIILPVFLIIGLVLIPIGTYRKLRLEKRNQTKREFKFPVVNLNEPSQRMVVIIFVIGTAFFLLFTAIGSYEVFHYTESNEFCGTMCHEVMEPEYVTYHGSAHARVRCVECHVGSGANWYVKSKLSGLYQVYSVLTKSYSQPIETPIHNLRPAQETCEKCHWPQKFYDPKYVTKKHYLADEENTEWNIQLLMKIGPQHSALGQSEGIHWHINPDVKIDYVSSNWKRDSIVEVTYTNLKTGEKRIFTSSEMQDVVHSNTQYRTMDCLDCHNRPSHDYKSPSHFVDNEIAAGNISVEIPEIKGAAMYVLAKEFPTKDTALMMIKEEIEKYYQNYYPEYFESNKAQIDQAILAIQEGYVHNVFPYMKASWKHYPNYMGHVESLGCFRCHNNQFASDDGHLISQECTLCHSIKAQGPSYDMNYAVGDSALEFRHPYDMEDWKEATCFECHKELF